MENALDIVLSMWSVLYVPLSEIKPVEQTMSCSTVINFPTMSRTSDSPVSPASLVEGQGRTAGSRCGIG